VFLSPFGGLRDNVQCSTWAHWKARSVNSFAAGHPGIFQIPPVPGQIGQYNV